VHALVCVIG